jgi:ketosteroid isomerase-like protein
MVTSRVVYEGGKVTRQPIEVTYRNITYYFDQAIAEIVNSNPAASEGQRGAGDLATLRTALNDWVAATNARDLEKLLKFYNSKIEVFYRARNVTSEFVREDKADSFDRAEAMEVSAGKPEITVNSDEQSATMRFRKEYFVKVNGRERRGRVLQVLEWKRTDEGWKIVGERDQRILR